MQTYAVPAFPDRENEDSVARLPGGAVLADGAGLPAVLRAGCRHSVAWFSQHLVAAMAHHAADAPTLTEAARAAVADVRAAHAGCSLEGGSPSATLAAVRVRGDRLEYFCLADSSILLVDADGRTTEIVDTRIDDTVLPATRELLAEWRRTGEVSAQDAHVESFRRTGEVLRNVPGGFWCAHVDPDAVDEALAGSVPLADVEAVVLASDGAVRGVHLLGIHDAATVAGRFVAGDTDAAFAEVRAEEERRREQLALDRTKLHDDMTVAVLTRADLAEPSVATAAARPQ